MLIKFKNEYTKIFSITLITFIFSLMSYSAIAQGGRIDKIKDAQNELKKIKSNGLVIAFPTNAPLIDNLRSRGFEEKAKIEEQKVLFYNLRLIEVFKAYSYGPIYYTHTLDLENANQSDELIVNNLDGSKVTVNPNEVLFLNPKKFTVKSQNSSYSGFGVHDKDFNYLNKPFPYFIFKRDGLILFQKTEEQMVQILQNKFLKLENVTF